MVHVFCLNENCRRVIRLHNQKYWNYKGKVKCSNCGTELELEIRDGKVLSCSKCEEA